MTERLSRLLCVKSIVTICLTIVFCVLCIKGTITGEQFLTVFTTVIAFYYGTQSTKNVKLEPVAVETATAELIPVETKENTITE